MRILCPSDRDEVVPVRVFEQYEGALGGVTGAAPGSIRHRRVLQKRPCPHEFSYFHCIQTGVTNPTEGQVVVIAAAWSRQTV